MAFNASDAPWAHEGQRIRAAYRVALNHWRGREDLQLVVIHAQLSAR
jgi:hypothetical protein